MSVDSGRNFKNSAHMRMIKSERIGWSYLQRPEKHMSFVPFSAPWTG